MTEFPQFRKLSNLKSFYCIEDDRTFIEMQLIGKQIFKIKIHASQYPEILKIKDMLACEPPYLMSSKTEYDQFNK